MQVVPQGTSPFLCPNMLDYTAYWLEHAVLLGIRTWTSCLPICVHHHPGLMTPYSTCGPESDVVARQLSVDLGCGRRDILIPPRRHDRAIWPKFGHEIGEGSRTWTANGPQENAIR
jgi:hypothetical protein